MINVAELITDQDFAQEYTVYRKRPQWVQGECVLTEDPPKVIKGVVIAANTHDLVQVPEGDRVKGIMCFYSVDPLYITNPSQISDEVVWGGDRYKLFQISPYRDYGYYKALGERMEGL